LFTSTFQQPLVYAATGCACSALFVLSDVFDAPISHVNHGTHEVMAEEVAVELTIPLLRYAGAMVQSLLLLSKTP
jgi:hypothetical protein